MSAWIQTLPRSSAPGAAGWAHRRIDLQNKRVIGDKEGEAA